jgi:hypothetical protein
VPRTARSVVFLLDCSISMGPSGALQAARAELLACLKALPPTTLFQVIPYNQQAIPLALDARRELVPAERGMVQRAAQLLEERSPGGGTDHGRALRAGLLLRPEVLYLVTDADDLAPADLRTAAHFNRAPTTIHVLELTRMPPGGRESVLRQLALDSGGTYRCVSPSP